MKTRIGKHDYDSCEGKYMVNGKTCYSILFGGDDGDAENGPRWWSGVDVVFASSADEAKKIWEAGMGERLNDLEDWSEPYLSSRDEIEEMERMTEMMSEELPFL